VTRRKQLCLALGAYVIGLIVTAPATLLDFSLQRATYAKLGIAEARGTLWSGAGLLEIRDARQQASIALSAAWHFSPQSLLLGRFSWDIELGGSSTRFPVTIFPSRIEIADARTRLPAELLGLVAPRLAPLALHGNVLLHVAQVSIRRDGRLGGDATLQWRNASSALAPIAPLGDYELRLTSEDGSVQALLRTLRGPLQLDGKGSWTSGGAPAFLVTAHVPKALQQQLAPLLRLIAVERGDGYFEARLK